MNSVFLDFPIDCFPLFISKLPSVIPQKTAAQEARGDRPATKTTIELTRIVKINDFRPLDSNQTIVVSRRMPDEYKGWSSVRNFVVSYSSHGSYYQVPG